MSPSCIQKIPSIAHRAFSRVGSNGITLKTVDITSHTLSPKQSSWIETFSTVRWYFITIFAGRAAYKTSRVVEIILLDAGSTNWLILTSSTFIRTHQALINSRVQIKACFTVSAGPVAVTGFAGQRYGLAWILRYTQIELKSIAWLALIASQSWTIRAIFRATVWRNKTVLTNERT